MASIAGGGVGAVAGYIEQTLAKTVPMVISGLASLLGLGGIADKIKKVLETIQKPVMNVVDKLVGTAVKFGKKLLGKLRGKKEETPEQKQKRLDDGMNSAVAAVNRFGGRPVITATILRPLLTVIRLRYRLTRLEPVLKGGTWTVEGEVNPKDSKSTSAKGTPLAVHYNPSPLDNYGRSVQAIGEPLMFSPTLVAARKSMPQPAPGKFLVPSQYKYEDGHLLPHSFGGPDSDPQNLAAISTGTNAQFTAVQNRVRAALQGNQGSPDVSVGRDHAAARPGRGGQRPPRVSSAMAMRDSGLRP